LGRLRGFPRDSGGGDPCPGWRVRLRKDHLGEGRTRAAPAHRREGPTGQLVHQDSYSALNPVRTVYQTLSAPLRRYGVPRSKLKEEVKRLLEFVGIMPPEYFLNKYPYHLSGGMRQRLVLARSIIPKPEFIVADEPVSMIDASLRLSILDLMLKLNQELKIAFLYIARKKKLMQLKEAEPPSAEAPPPGCRFHPRCPYAHEVCGKEEPPLRDFGEGHRVACHLVDTLPPWRLI